MLTVGVPVSTTSSAGLQSAQDKRSIQSYEPAKYLVIPPVGTWNPAVTSSAELSGCTTLVAGERAVLAGAGGGIYIADSATAMHLDDSFTGVKGYSVVVTEVAGQPTYRWDGTAFALATGGGSSGTGDYQVQYVANNIVTSLATYYSSLVSPQTGDKHLLPVTGSGAILGVYLVSSGALIPDPGWSVIEGQKIQVIRTASRPAYMQTATTGSATPSFLFFSLSSTELVVGQALTNPLIDHSNVGNSRTSFQVNFPWVVVNPYDATQLRMYYTTIGGSGNSICVATANISDPTTWTPYASNPVNSAYEYLDTLILPADSPDGKWWMYCSHGGGTQVDLLVSTDGLTWTVDTANVLTYNGQGRTDGTGISSMSVLKDDSTHWHGYYNYRAVAPNDLKGIRYATSSNGKAWTKAGAGDILHVQGGTAWDTLFESQQIIKIGSVYVLVCSTNGTASDNITGHWTINCFGSFTPDFASSFTLPTLKLSLEKKGYQTSTPHFKKIGSQWYAFYQYASIIGDYGLNNWDIGCVRIDGSAIDAVQALTPATPASYGTLPYWFRPDRGQTLSGSNITALVNQGTATATLANAGTVAYDATNATMNTKPTAIAATIGPYLQDLSDAVNLGGATTATIVFIGYSGDTSGHQYAQLGTTGSPALQLDYMVIGGNTYVAGDGVALSRHFAGSSIAANTALCLVTTFDFVAHTVTFEVNGVTKTVTGDNLNAPAENLVQLLVGWLGGVSDYMVFAPALDAGHLASLKSGYINPRYGAITS